MNPSDLKTRSEAIAAARAVNEARLVCSGVHAHVLGGQELREALCELERSYWERAEELRYVAGKRKRKAAK